MFISWAVDATQKRLREKMARGADGELQSEGIRAGEGGAKIPRMIAARTMRLAKNQSAVYLLRAAFAAQFKASV